MPCYLRRSGGAPNALSGIWVGTATTQLRASGTIPMQLQPPAVPRAASVTGASPAIIPTFGRSGCHLGPKNTRLT